MNEIYTVPADLKNKGINNFFLKKKTTKCWYTGLPVVLVRITDDMVKHQSFYIKLFPNMATKEHIYASSRMCNLSRLEFLDINSRFNVVPACMKINNAIGDAPIPVKLEIRRELHKLCANLTELDDELLIKLLHVVKTIRDSYLINGKYPKYLRQQQQDIIIQWNDYFKTANWDEIYNVN